MTRSRGCYRLVVEGRLYVVWYSLWRPSRTAREAWERYLLR